MDGAPTGRARLSASPRCEAEADARCVLVSATGTPVESACCQALGTRTCRWVALCIVVSMECVNRGCIRHLPLCLAPELSGIYDQSSKLVAALRYEADADCVPIMELALRKGRSSTKAGAAAAACLFALHRRRQGSPTSRVGLQLLFGARWMKTVCLSGLHSGEAACQQRLPPPPAVPLCFAPEPSTRDLLRPIEHCLRLLFVERRMQTVCLSG